MLCYCLHSSFRGHGTYMEDEQLIASVAGIVETVNELISVLVDQLDALFVDRSGQAVAEDVQSLLDLRLVGLVLQKRKNV